VSFVYNFLILKNWIFLNFYRALSALLNELKLDEMMFTSFLGCEHITKLSLKYNVKKFYVFKYENKHIVIKKCGYLKC